jgi:hypothetical protein
MHVHITLRLAAPLLLVGLLACGESTSPASESPERRDIVNTGTKRYSQFDEELVIRDFFQDRTEGVFLDVGSSTPMKNSTTYPSTRGCVPGPASSATSSRTTRAPWSRSTA